MDAEPDADARPGAGELLQRLQVDLVGQPAAADLLRVGHAEEAELAEVRKTSRGKLGIVLGRRGAGRQLGLRDSRARATISSASGVGSRRSAGIGGDDNGRRPAPRRGP